MKKHQWVVLWVLALCALGGVLVWMAHDDDRPASFAADPDYRVTDKETEK
jgi:hypothetical protein